MGYVHTMQVLWSFIVVMWLVITWFAMKAKRKLKATEEMLQSLIQAVKEKLEGTSYHDCVSDAKPERDVLVEDVKEIIAVLTMGFQAANDKNAFTTALLMNVLQVADKDALIDCIEMALGFDDFNAHKNDGMVN